MIQGTSDRIFLGGNRLYEATDKKGAGLDGNTAAVW